MVCTNFLSRVVLKTDQFGPFLARVFGIGVKSAKTLCRAAGLQYKDLIAPAPLHKVLYLEQLVNKSYSKEFELRRFVNANLVFKYTAGMASGLRLSQGLPARGQRSKTNAKTARRLKIDFSKLL
jgi:small subunit ribosomal protein S13